MERGLMKMSIKVLQRVQAGEELLGEQWRLWGEGLLLLRLSAETEEMAFARSRGGKTKRKVEGLKEVPTRGSQKGRNETLALASAEKNKNPTKNQFCESGHRLLETMLQPVKRI